MSNVTIKGLLPDFERNTTKLMAVLIAQIFALTVTLLTFESNFYLEFGLISTYCIWFAIIYIMGLVVTSSVLRRPMSMLRAQLVITLVFLLAFLITESFVQYFYLSDPYQSWGWQRFIRLFAVAMIVNLVLIRVYVLKTVMQARSRSQSEMKLLALQSRIRPHFLFNSLNAISELVHVDAALADESIQSLSYLFRASLQGHDNLHSLAAEVRLCQRYIELESLRFGDKLKVAFNQSVSDAQKWQCPKLLIQPIVENAVTHGTRDDGTVVAEVDVRETEKHISIKVSNLVANIKSDTSGNGIAIDSIKETLFVLYDDDFKFSSKVNEEWYEVIIRIPKQTQREPKL